MFILFLAIGLCCCVGISLAAESRDHSPAAAPLSRWGCSHCGAMWGLLELWRVGSGAEAPGPWSTGSIAVAHGLRCSTACGVFPDQGSNPGLLHGQAGSSPLSHQGRPSRWLFIVISGPVMGISREVFLHISLRRKGDAETLWEVQGHRALARAGPREVPVTLEFSSHNWHYFQDFMLQTSQFSKIW